MVLELLAEGVGKASEPAHAHPSAEILALYMAGANPLGIGASDAWDYLRAYHLSRRVPALAFHRGPVDLDELREVYAILKGVGDSRAVRREAIRGELEVARGRLPQPLNENVRAGLVAFANRDVQGQLAVGFHGHEGVAVAKGRIVARPHPLFLLPDEAPNLVGLDIPYRNVHELLAHQALRLLAREYQELQNRGVVNFGQALHAGHAIALQEHPQNHLRLLGGQVHAL